MEDQRILAKYVANTKSVGNELSSLSVGVRPTNQMYNLLPPSSTQRQGQKLKPRLGVLEGVTKLYIWLVS